MSTEGCVQARGQVALSSIGRLPKTERLSLDAHLDGCSDCRSELADLSGMAAALSSAEPDRVDDGVKVPETLHSRVLGSLNRDVALHRRSVRLKFAAAAAVVLLAIGAGSLATDTLVRSHNAPSSHTFALVGPDGSDATAQLTAQSWGTSVALRAYGEQGDGVLTVSMRTNNGSWWVAGTYRAVTGVPVDVTMSCAVPLAEIDAVRITNAAGNQLFVTSPGFDWGT